MNGLDSQIFILIMSKPFSGIKEKLFLLGMQQTQSLGICL
jgi:hypothetical protein